MISNQWLAWIIKDIKANYGKLEEVLSKSSPSDIESGITLASEAIEKYEMDAKLYLLQAKLSFKLLVIKQFCGRVNESIKNCLEDCERAIAIIERGNVRGDITVIKKEAIQLGYLCCVELKNSQKQRKFEHHLSELGIAIPDTEQTKIELLCMKADQQHAPSNSPLETDSAANRPQNNNQLYCGYCNIQCETPAGLVAHCKQDPHKYAVFADSGRDVFWKFEPPPPNMKKNKISGVYGVDKAKEWKDRLNRRNANKSVNELPFGLNDKSIEHKLTDAICGLETELQCSHTAASASFLLVGETSEKIIWTLEIKGNQHHSFRGVKFKKESVFKLTQVQVRCSTNCRDFKIKNNMYYSPEKTPGLLLGIVRVKFFAIPNITNVYENEILIDVGLSKCLSVPIELIVVATKISKCLKSGKLLLDIESIFSSSKLKIKRLSSSSVSVEEKLLTERYCEQLKQKDLHCNNCATLLESTDQTLYYEKLCTFLYLEGDHRRRLLLRVSKQKISTQLILNEAQGPSLKVELQKLLRDNELAEYFLLLNNSLSIFLQFLSGTIQMCPGAKLYIWECNKTISNGALWIQLPPSFPRSPKLDGEYFTIALEFSEDFTYLAQCHAAVECFKRHNLDYLLFPSNQVYYPNTKSFTCQSPLKEWSTKLNPQQVSAMEAILLSESVLPVVIAGPFGTGKTFLLSQAAEYLVNYSKHCHILICTYTNSAANVYLEYFHQRISSNRDCKILRLVYKPQKYVPPPHLQKYFLYNSSNMEYHLPTKPQAEKYHIIVTTLAMAQEILQLKLTNHFTHIFIDEAAQMTIPEVMMALSLASNTTKVVLAGDHMQMNPKVYSPLVKEYDLHKSPLEQICNEYSELHEHKILLFHNYRTHKDILKLPSKFFYQDKLKSCNIIRKHPDFKSLKVIKSNHMEEYSSRFMSYLNVDEADNIIRFLKETLLPNWPNKEWGQLKDNSNSIGILTTEYAQADYIHGCLKKKQIPNIFVDTITNAKGLEFRVLILSVVRTRHSINKDSLHQCGFYTEKRVLNTAFTRVQSLIVTAAHPLSLITRGNMTCRLFWASYLSESLSDEECNQLSKEFFNECQGDSYKGAENGQLGPEDQKIYNILLKVQSSIPDDEEHHDQILNNLAKHFDANEAKTVAAANALPRNLSIHASSIQPSAVKTSDTSSSTAMLNHSELSSYNPIVANSTNVVGIGFMTNTKICYTYTAIIHRLHRPYIANFSPEHTAHTVMITKGAESGYAIMLNPAVKDICLPDRSALNRSLRGDTVVIDQVTEKKGIVVNNFSDHMHPKQFFVCFSDRRTKNLFVPIDRQYPKIDSLQQNVIKNGLHIYHHYVDGKNKTDNYYTIKYGDIEEYVYLVWLNRSWEEDHVYPKGVPVHHLSLRDSMLRGSDKSLTKFMDILKYNYIPAMVSDYGKFQCEVVDHRRFPRRVVNQVEKRFSRHWKIPHYERKKRKIYKDVFTIDDKETVVLDDALSLGFDQDKNFVINVHIADASYFVKPGSDLDTAALERGKSFYINYGKDLAIFMLPDNICMEHGSLQAGKDRLAVTTQFVFSKKDYSLLSPLSDVEVHRSIVRSVCRLTKEDAGRFILDKSMTQLKGMSLVLFSKMKEDLSILNKIATKLKQSQWPDSYLYEPDRGKQDKYSMAGSSLVEMFMCLCNTAIPAKLLKRDGRVGPVLVHKPIKHHKQREWLEKHHHLLECCPLLKRMISNEVLHDHQDVQGIEAQNRVLTVSQKSWDRIHDLAGRSDGNSLATYLSSLHNFPELFVAYRQLCKSQSKSFYDVIPSQAQESDYKHSHFNDIYTHFTSPLRRYCDILVHRAVLGETSLPSVEHKLRGLLHKMNIHKWDEREFSRQRNALYFMDCSKKVGQDIAVTVYVGKITNRLMELHAPPELQDFLPDRVCEIKLSHLQAEGYCKKEFSHLQAEGYRKEELSHLQAEGDRKNEFSHLQAEGDSKEKLARLQAEGDRKKELSRLQAEGDSKEKFSRLQAEGERKKEKCHVTKWQVERIPAPGTELGEENINTKFNIVEIPLDMLAKVIETVHSDIEETKKLIKSCNTELKDLKCKEPKCEEPKCKISKYEEPDVEQRKTKYSRKLAINKYIRECGSVLDVQFSSIQEKSYAIEPTVSLVHISRTFACCLLHVKHPIQCYVPNISKSPPVHLKKMSNYISLWWPAVSAESITSSIRSKRIPVIIKNLKLQWTSTNKAQFIVTDYEDYQIEFQNPFFIHDYVCIQYRNLLPNPISEYFDLDSNKKVTWVAHGRIVKEEHGQIMIEFAKNTAPPKIVFSESISSPIHTNFSLCCDLEVIPLQVTFRRIYKMFKEIKKQKYNRTFIEEICCRSYANPLVEINPIICNIKGDCKLNRGQREVLEKALVDKNKLLLIQGPPGTGKSRTCVNLIKCFVDLNYKEGCAVIETGPTILYCAPSNKAVNVGARTMLEKYPEVTCKMYCNERCKEPCKVHCNRHSKVHHIEHCKVHCTVHILRVCGTNLEDMDFPGLGDIIPMFAKRKVSFENDEDTSKIPKDLQKHCLHFKIRDPLSKKDEVKAFIKYEKNLSENKSTLEHTVDYKELKKISDKYYALKKSAESVVIEDAQVIFCTCAEAGSNRISTCTSNQINTRTVKQCIIDECGMCTEPETLLPMILSEKVILVGDHKQLQPVVISKAAESLGLKISMFQRLFEDKKMSRYCTMLTEQYRMHPSICDFPSNQFYDGKLVAAEEVLERKWSGKLPPDIWKQSQTQRCVFIHVDGQDGDEEISGIDAEGSYEESRSNEKEAKKVEMVVKKLLETTNNISEHNIMVLTPYRAQVNCCMNKFKKAKKTVEITTIHGSQGRECDVVILTTVRSLPEEDIPDHPSHTWVNENLGFVTDEHLMNVAITRAKEALCIIGNKKLLEKHKMWKSLLDHYTEHNCII